MDELEKLDAPKITILGKEYPVKEFSVRQTIFAEPRIRRLGTIKAGQWTEDQLTVLYDLLFCALNGADPKITRAAFDDMPIPIVQAVEALPTIIERLGYNFGAPKDAAPPLAEAPAETSEQTGTA